MLIGVWALASGWPARQDVTGPIAFPFARYVLGSPGWGPLAIAVGSSSLHPTAEVTLVLILFSDAARANMAEAVATVSIAVLLSVILHGVSAGPGGRRVEQREGPETTAHTPRPRPSGLPT